MNKQEITKGRKKKTRKKEQEKKNISLKHIRKKKHKALTIFDNLKVIPSAHTL
jgi:hypothetical protein